MARATRKKKELEVDAYAHTDKKRLNNPPVGLVSTQTDKLNGRTQYQHDPHIDPHLSWAGKAEGASFEVQNVSLHVHERIEPKRIIKSFLTPQPEQRQMSLFDVFQKKEPLHQAVEFYSHSQGWSNRLIAGDSLLVMNSLLQKEAMRGKVQCVYFDPPYGIKYRSNFQPFVNKRDSKEDADETLPGEPETLTAFRDTWELHLHSWLTYLRDRLLLAREVLSDKGSVFLQINDKNLHHAMEVVEEVFGATNFVSLICFTKAPGGLESKNALATRTDYIIWFAKKKESMTLNSVYEYRDNPIADGFDMVELPDGTRRRLKKEERQGQPLPKGSRLFMSVSFSKPGPGSKYEIDYEGRTYSSGRRWWGLPKESLMKLIEMRRVVATENEIRFIKYFDDFPYRGVNSLWTGFAGAANPVYVVQTNPEVVKRCLFMASNPGDLVFDPTCGSGTTAMVAEEIGRRWITCDTSRVAISLAKQRMLTTSFLYFKLAHPQDGVSGGFEYKTINRITAESLSKGLNDQVEYIYNEPIKDNAKVRVCGPFTVEAVPSLRTKPFGNDVPEVVDPNKPSHSGETAKYIQWMDELKATGVRGIGGKRLEFSRIEPSTATRFVHAIGELLDDKGVNRIAAVSFGPDYGPLEQRQVEQAITEVRSFKNKPDFIIFCAFQFDPEAAKDIEEIDLSGTRVLKVQMTADLLTTDLRKKRSSNESFWLIGQPEVELKKQKDGKYKVTVNGFDYYNPATGELSSGGADKIAMWMLDTNYDDRSLLPEQVFFPQNDSKRDWTKLAKSLNGLIDEELLEAFVGSEYCRERFRRD